LLLFDNFRNRAVKLGAVNRADAARFLLQDKIIEIATRSRVT
jgi:hypothetical protein